jgi:hypothetical protein
MEAELPPPASPCCHSRRGEVPEPQNIFRTRIASPNIQGVAERRPPKDGKGGRRPDEGVRFIHRVYPVQPVIPV